MIPMYSRLELVTLENWAWKIGHVIPSWVFTWVKGNTTSEMGNITGSRLFDVVF